MVAYSQGMLQLPDGDHAAYIFDCDGTLAASMPLHYVAWREAFEAHRAKFAFTWELFTAWQGWAHTSPSPSSIAGLVTACRPSQCRRPTWRPCPENTTPCARLSRWSSWRASWHESTRFRWPRVGRATTSTKRSSTLGVTTCLAEFAPIVERLQLDASRWVETVRRYGSFYHQVAGQFEHISEVAKFLGKRWLCVTSAAREHGTYQNDPRPQPCEAFC